MGSGTFAALETELEPGNRSPACYGGFTWVLIEMVLLFYRES